MPSTNPAVSRKEIRRYVAKFAETGRIVLENIDIDARPYLENQITEHSLAIIFDAYIIRQIMYHTAKCFESLNDNQTLNLRLLEAISIAILDSMTQLSPDEVRLLHEYGYVEAIRNYKVTNTENRRVEVDYFGYLVDGKVPQKYQTCISRDIRLFGVNTKEELEMYGVNRESISRTHVCNVNNPLFDLNNVNFTEHQAEIIRRPFEPNWQYTKEWEQAYINLIYSPHSQLSWGITKLLIPCELDNRSNFDLQIMYKWDMKNPHEDAADVFALIVFMCDDLLELA